MRRDSELSTKNPVFKNCILHPDLGFTWLCREWADRNAAITGSRGGGEGGLAQRDSFLVACQSHGVFVAIGTTHLGQH